MFPFALFENTPPRIGVLNSTTAVTITTHKLLIYVQLWRYMTGFSYGDTWKGSDMETHERVQLWRYMKGFSYGDTWKGSDMEIHERVQLWRYMTGFSYGDTWKGSVMEIHDRVQLWRYMKGFSYGDTWNGSVMEIHERVQTWRYMNGFSMEIHERVQLWRYMKWFKHGDTWKGSVMEIHERVQLWRYTLRGLTFGPLAFPWIVRTSSTSTTSTQDGRKISSQPHDASPLAGMDYDGRREGRDARRLGVGAVGCWRFRPLGLGMASFPPLSSPMGSRSGEMWGRQCRWWVSPGLLVIWGSPNSNLPPGLK